MVILLVHPDDRERPALEFAKLFEETDKPNCVEIRYKHKDGTYRDIEVVGLNLINDPAINGIILTSHDISRLKQAERDINLLNKNLEQRITERTMELMKSQENLRQSEKMRAIGQLAGGVAHDFNNQLTGIIGFADLIKISCDKNDEIYDYADTIVNTTLKAADLIRQLLTFARKVDYKPIQININELIDEVIALLYRTVNKNIKIRKNFKSNTAQCLVDPSQLHNALLNLGINARDAMPDGGDITFATRNVYLDDKFCDTDQFSTEPGWYILIEVTDTGTGISSDNIEQIFEPFFTTKKTGEGSGMGLAAVYGTVKKHKGTINVKSTIGKGSTFELYLPISISDEDDKNIIEEKIVLQIEKSHILVVDDEDVVSMTISKILKKHGHSVKIYQNGNQAIEYYKNSWKDIDLVILDMIMPGLNGSDLFDQMIKLNPTAKIIITSGYSFNSNIENLISAGASSFLQKPFSIDELIKHVNIALK